MGDQSTDHGEDDAPAYQAEALVRFVHGDDPVLVDVEEVDVLLQDLPDPT